MKRFLISFTIGITMMAVGVTTLIFELDDFTFVENSIELLGDGYYQKTVPTNSKTVFRIEDGISYSWDYDETMYDGEVKIEAENFINVQNIKNEVIVRYNDDKDYHSFSDANTDGWKTFNKFIDGLKEHKVYTYHNLRSIRFISNHNTKSLLQFKYEE